MSSSDNSFPNQRALLREHLGRFTNEWTRAARFVNDLVERFAPQATLDVRTRLGMEHNARLIEDGVITSEVGHLREVPLLFRRGVDHMRDGNFGPAALFFFGAGLNTFGGPMVPTMLRDADPGRRMGRDAIIMTDSLFPGALNHDDFEYDFRRINIRD